MSVYGASICVYTCGVCVWCMHMCVKKKADFKCSVQSLCTFSFLRRHLSLIPELDWPQTASVTLQSLTPQHTATQLQTQAGPPLASLCGLWGFKLDYEVNTVIH